MKVLIVVTSADRLPSGAPTGLWLEEFAIPFCALTEAGIEVVVAAPHGGPAPIDAKSVASEDRSAPWIRPREALAATVPLAGISDAGFDALFLPGGHGPLADLAGDPALKALAAAFARDGRIIAAVCHGPAGLLGVAGPGGEPLLAGRRATGFTNGEEVLAGMRDKVPFLLEDRMRAEGALFEHALLPGACHLVVDGVLITGQNPASSTAVARSLVEALGERQRRLLAVAATTD